MNKRLVAGPRDPHFCRLSGISFKQKLVPEDEPFVPPHSVHLGHNIRQRIVNGFTPIRNPLDLFRYHYGEARSHIVGRDHVERLGQANLEANVKVLSHIVEKVPWFKPVVLHKFRIRGLGKKLLQVLEDWLSTGFNAPVVDVKLQGELFIFSKLNGSQSLQQVILERPHSPETADVEEFAFTKARLRWAPQVHIGEEIEESLWDDSAERFKTLFGIRYDADILVGVTIEPIHRNSFKRKKRHVGVKVHEPLYLRVKAGENVKLLRDNPKSLNDDKVGVVLRHLSVDVIIVLDFDDVRPNIFFSQSLNDKSGGVVEPTGPTCVDELPVDFALLTDKKHLHCNTPEESLTLTSPQNNQQKVWEGNKNYDL